MSLSTDLAALFGRDLIRLVQELQAFPDDQTLWRTLPGMGNSAGNLTLHLEGNLREFIGRQLGHLPYQRRRESEFSTTGLSKDDLVERIKELQHQIPNVLEGLSGDRLSATYPEDVLGKPLSTHQFLVHLCGHFNYHLGQIDCLRRILTSGDAVRFAGL